jgi:hypothetical protein
MSQPRSTKNKPHPKPDQTNGKHDECKVRGDIYVRGEIESNRPASLSKEHYAEREEDKASARHNFWVGVGTFIAVAIYAGITFWQGRLTRESIDKNTEQFRVDQRAWVSMSVDPVIPIQNDVQIMWPLHIHNVGKTFAKNIEGDFFATVLAKGDSPQFDYSVGHPHRKINVGGIFPNEALPQISIRIEQYGPHIPEAILMTQELRQAIASNQRAIIVYGRITYDDIFGVHHWTQFCNGTGDALQFASIKNCINYNDADNNH